MNVDRNRRGLKRRRVEMAIDWLVEHPHGTYAKASSLFDIPVNSIRSRVQYKFGTLAECRSERGVGKVSPQRKRRCLCCRVEKEMEKNIYLCDPCREKVNNTHDGAV